MRTIVIKKGTAGGAGGPATRVAEEVNFVAPHGFTAGQWIYQVGVGAWALARANSSLSAAPSGVVESVQSTTKLTLVRQGVASFASAVLAAGNVMYLSPDVAGAMVTTPPEADGTFRTALGRGISSSQMEVMIRTPEAVEKIPYSNLSPDVAASIAAALFAGAQHKQALVWDAEQGKAVPGSAIPDGATESWARQNIGGASIDMLTGPRFVKTLEAGETWNVSFTNFGTARSPLFLFVNAKGAATINWDPTKVIPGTPQPTAGKTSLFVIHADSTFGWVEKSPTVWDLDLTNPTISTWTVVAAGNMIAGPADEGIKVFTGGAGGWTITASGGAVTSTGVLIDGNTCNVVLSRVINQGETVTIAYANPSNTGVVDMYNNPLSSFSAKAVTNSSQMSNFLLKFGFETGAAYPGATESGSTYISWGSTDSPISGAYSLRVSGDGTSTHRYVNLPFSKAVAYVDIRVRVRLNSRATITNQSFMELLTAGGSSLVQIQDRTDGSLRLQSGGQVIPTSGNANTGANMTVWLRYQQGTGANAVASLWFSNSGSLTRPASPAATTSISTATGLAGMLRFSSRSGIDITVDDVIASETPLGDGVIS